MRPAWPACAESWRWSSKNTSAPDRDILPRGALFTQVR
jgi:hypothetical protein